MSNSIMHI